MANDRELALQYLGDCLYGATLGLAGATRPSDLVRSLPHGMRVGVGLIRQLLEEDERFEEVAGRFELASQDELRKRPFGGAVAQIIEEHERPVPIPLMVTALARLRGGSPDHFRTLLDKFEASRDVIAYAADHVVHSDWLLLLEGENEEQMLFYNELDDDDQLREMWEEAEERDLRKRDPGLTAANILEAYDRPVGPLQLAFLTWLHHPQIFDAIEFVELVLERDDVVPAAGMWLSEGCVERLHDELRSASDELSGEGEEAPEVDIEEVLAREAPSTPFKLEDDDRANIMSVVSGVQVPIGIDELIIDLLEIGPDERRFVAAAHTLEEILEDQADLIRVAPGRYLSREAIPDWIHEVPTPLMPVESDFDEDVLLEIDGLPGELREEVLDPVYEDVGAGIEFEPDEELMAEDSTEVPLLHHHYVVGTMPIRSIDEPLFADQPETSLLLVRFGDADVYPAWLNREIGLLFGLSRLYQRELPPSGAIFRVSHSDSPDTLVFKYDGETEDELTPNEERMSELERKRERVSHRPISINDLMIELLNEHEAGLSFNALWAEMNVVQRTSRWQIASMLTLYPHFVEDDGTWRYDRDRLEEAPEEDLLEFVIQTEDEEAEQEEEAQDEEDAEDEEPDDEEAEGEDEEYDEK